MMMAKAAMAPAPPARNFHQLALAVPAPNDHPVLAPRRGREQRCCQCDAQADGEHSATGAADDGDAYGR